MRQLLIALVAFVLGCSYLQAAQAATSIVSLSFDDASWSQDKHAFPIMQRAGIKGTLFVAPGKLGTDPFFMNWSEVKVMQKAGWDIESHTFSHPDLTKLNVAQAYGELAYSQLILTKRLGVKPKLIATPYGAFNDQTIALMKRLYTAHFMAWGGNNGFNDLSHLNLFHLGRYEVKGTYTAADVCATLRSIEGKNQWLVLEFHQIGANEVNRYNLPADVFSGIVKCAISLQQQGRLKIETAAQALSNLSAIEGE